MKKNHFSILLMILCCMYIGQAQNITIPDAAFKRVLVDNSQINTNGDGEISVTEAENTTTIDASFANISDTSGLEYFINLESLNLSANNFTEIDLSKNSKLKRLNLEENSLRSLDARNCQLETLYLYQNAFLKELFLTNQPLGYRTIPDGSGRTELDLYFTDCESLEFICADAKYLDDIKAKADDRGEDLPPLEVTSNCGDDQNQTYPIVWTDLVNVSVDGNTITKTANRRWWNAGAASVNTIPANEDGFIEMTVGNPSTDVMFGLSYANTSYAWNTIDFNMYVSRYRGTNVVIYQRSRQITSNRQLGSYARGDKMRVERQGSTVYFKKNGNTLYSLPVDPSRSLVADVSLYDYQSQVIDAICSHPAGARAKSVVLANPKYDSLFEMSSLESNNGLANDAKIVLTPNPSNGLLHINSNTAVNKMIIRSFTGQVVYKQEGFEAGTVDLKLNGAPGLYTVSFEVEGQMITKKVVKL